MLYIGAILTKNHQSLSLSLSLTHLDLIKTRQINLLSEKNGTLADYSYFFSKCPHKKLT